MTNCKCFITRICLLMLIMGYQGVDAQQQLPYGAKARFGINKGAISDTAFTPDGTRLAIASRIGVWLYEAATGAGNRYGSLRHHLMFPRSHFHRMAKRLRVAVM